jgi:hypothetical protein
MLSLGPEASTLVGWVISPTFSSARERLDHAAVELVDIGVLVWPHIVAVDLRLLDEDFLRIDGESRHRILDELVEWNGAGISGVADEAGDVSGERGPRGRVGSAAEPDGSGDGWGSDAM